MPTKAELKAKALHIKLKIRKGDRVKVIAGKDKGQEGLVVAVDQEKQKALIFQENPEKAGEFRPLNAAIKHQKAKYQGEKSARVVKATPIHISNLMVIDPATKEPSRLGRKTVDGKIIRYSKKSGNEIPVQELPSPE
ncbi:MAG: 50S ribosomal protein L24 [Fimbriimonadaceae bacterium]|jgi:large subunit ribosomal protein L24